MNLSFDFLPQLLERCLVLGKFVPNISTLKLPVVRELLLQAANILQAFDLLVLLGFAFLEADDAFLKGMQVAMVWLLLLLLLLLLHYVLR